MPGKTPLTDEQRRLAESVYPKLLKIASSRAAGFPHLRADFESAMGAAACDAARRYDPSRGVSFEKFAAQRAYGACLDVLRECGTMLGSYRTSDGRIPGKVVSLDAAAEFDDGSGASYASLIPSEDEPIGWEVESEDEVLRLSRKLPPRHGEAVRRYYLHAATPTLLHVSRAMGCTESRMSQVTGEAFSMLRADPASPQACGGPHA